jgi:hypothetical protein
MLLCVAIGNSASAQFWKGGGGKTKKVNTSNKYPLRPIQKPAQKLDKPKEKKREVNYPNSVQKERYRIDIMIPLFLDELVEHEKPTFKGKIPDKAQAAINFYEGIKLAADTLAYMGYKTDLYVHDITAKGKTIDDLKKNDSLKNSDLIIGYVSNLDVATLANFAAKQRINFVSAFSPSDANVKDNPFLFLLNPSLESNCRFISESLCKKRKNSPVIVFKRETLAVDSAAYRFVMDNKELKDAKIVDCNKLLDSSSLGKVLDSSHTNTLLMPIMDALYAEKMIQDFKKYFPNYRFEIYGMPTWKSIVSNRKMIELGNQFTIDLPQPYYYDASNAFGQIITQKYKSAFGGIPNDMTFRGFELVYWLTDLLNKYGTIFNEKMEDKSMAPFTRYEFKPKWDIENNYYYNENKNLYLYHYQSGTILVN